jgi:hypothetical protein
LALGVDIVLTGVVVIMDGTAYIMNNIAHSFSKKAWTRGTKNKVAKPAILPLLSMQG